MWSVGRAVERRHAKIVKAEVVPWEIDEGLYGVAYTTNEGWEGSDLIGTKAEAETVV